MRLEKCRNRNLASPGQIAEAQEYPGAGDPDCMVGYLTTYINYYM